MLPQFSKIFGFRLKWWNVAANYNPRQVVRCLLLFNICTFLKHIVQFVHLIKIIQVKLPRDRKTRFLSSQWIDEGILQLLSVSYWPRERCWVTGLQTFQIFWSCYRIHQTVHIEVRWEESENIETKYIIIKKRLR